MTAPLRARLRRLAMGLATVTGIAPRGWFIPYRYRGSTPEGGNLPVYGALEARFRAAEPMFQQAIAGMESHWPALAALFNTRPPAPRFEQMWFPGLDGAFAYGLIRDRRPARLVEVGSGHSTRFFARAVADGRLGTRITAIDPAPRADIAGLAGVEVIRATVQAAGGAPFAALGPGDVLAIDSSHILMPGSDVDMLFNRILPGLPAGVLVQIHDILLPDDYPPAWSWRGYNEQQALGPLLRSGAELLWSSHYVRSRMADRLARGPLSVLPLKPGAMETALWLKLS